MGFFFFTYHTTSFNYRYWCTNLIQLAVPFSLKNNFSVFFAFVWSCKYFLILSFHVYTPSEMCFIHKTLIKADIILLHKTLIKADIILKLTQIGKHFFNQGKHLLLFQQFHQ